MHDGTFKFSNIFSLKKKVAISTNLTSNIYRFCIMLKNLLKPNLNRSYYLFLIDIRLSMHKNNSHADSHISADNHDFSFCTHLCLER